MRPLKKTVIHDDVSAWRLFVEWKVDASARSTALGRHELGEHVPDANGRVLCDPVLGGGRGYALPGRARHDRILCEPALRRDEFCPDPCPVVG
jgi:hypothetical protein